MARFQHEGVKPAVPSRAIAASVPDSTAPSCSIGSLDSRKATPRAEGRLWRQAKRCMGGFSRTVCHLSSAQGCQGKPREAKPSGRGWSLWEKVEIDTWVTRPFPDQRDKRIPAKAATSPNPEHRTMLFRFALRVRQDQIIDLLTAALWPLRASWEVKSPPRRADRS
jgi:hypothetical protein